MKLKDLSMSLIENSVSIELENVRLVERGLLLVLPGGKYQLKVDMPVPTRSGVIPGLVGFVNLDGVYLGNLLAPNEAVLAVIDEIGEHRIGHVIEEAARRMSDLARKKAKSLKTERNRLLRIGKTLKVISKGKLPKEKKK